METKTADTPADVTLRRFLKQAISGMSHEEAAKATNTSVSFIKYVRRVGKHTDEPDEARKDDYYLQAIRRLGFDVAVVIKQDRKQHSGDLKVVVW